MDEQKERLIADALKELDLDGEKPSSAPTHDSDIDDLVNSLLGIEEAPEKEEAPEPKEETAPEPRPEPVPAEQVVPDYSEPTRLPDDGIPPVAPKSTFKEVMQETEDLDDPRFREPEPLPEDEPAAYEYESPEQKEEVLSLLKGNSRRAFFQSVGLLILFAVSLAVAILKRADGVLPAVLTPGNGIGYLLCVAAPLLLAIVLAYPVIASGFRGLFKKHGNRDTLITLTALLCLIQPLVGMIDPTVATRTDVHFYAPVAVAGMVCEMVGKWVQNRRILRQFKFVSSEDPRFATLLVEDSGAAIDITRGMISNELPSVAYRKETEFVDGFFSATGATDASDRMASVATPLVLAIALCLGIAGYLITSDFYVAFTVLVALLVAASPVAVSLAANLPASRAAKRLSSGAVMLGGRDLDEICYTNTAMLTGQELFPAGSVALQGIKTFSGNRVDEALLDAASVICSGNSLLSDVFRQILGNDTHLLRKVENLQYVDLQGMVATVQGREVLIGSRNLMIAHGVQVPTTEYEDRYADEGIDLVYLSTSHELTAVFLVTLQADETVEHALRLLEKEGIPIVVQTMDALLTGERIGTLFGLAPDTVRVLPARLHGIYDEMTEKTDRVKAAVVTNGTLSSYVYSIVSAIRMKSTAQMSLVLQSVGTVLGIVLCVALVLTDSAARIGGAALLLHQLIWSLVSILIPSLKRL